MDEEGAGWWASALDPSRGLGMTRLWVSTVTVTRNDPPRTALEILGRGSG